MPTKLREKWTVQEHWKWGKRDIILNKNWEPNFDCKEFIY
jgi:hypothetical protein